MSDNENLPATVPTIVEEPADFTVIATNPSEMERGQKSLILWAARKIQAEKELLKDAQEQLDIATKNKWKKDGWRRVLKLSEEKIEFYRKVKMALEAGYYIVPPFPMDVFAFRTEHTTSSRRYEVFDKRALPEEHPKPLPIGVGNYKMTVPKADVAYGYVKNAVTGKDEYQRIGYKPGTFLKEFDFPFKLARAEILQETAEALALKVFDAIGKLPGDVMRAKTAQAVTVSADPIICGQILAPHKNNAPVTFFIAWWLDTKTL